MMISTGAVLCTSYVSCQVGIDSENPNPSSILTVTPIDLKRQYKGTFLKTMTMSPINKPGKRSAGV
ncbi:hypothetical protein [Chryseobacterium angstadtii]|nr:hypothetical protein [Chryseobacterium angstadtii]